MAAAWNDNNSALEEVLIPQWRMAKVPKLMRTIVKPEAAKDLGPAREVKNNNKKKM
jgi:hypothetical protein